MAVFMGIVETGEGVEKLLYQIDYPKANVYRKVVNRDRDSI